MISIEYSYKYEYRMIVTDQNDYNSSVKEVKTMK